MINKYKITQLTAKAQVAGLHPSDDNIEFIGVCDTQEVLWMSHGNANEFKHLPKWAFRICQHQYLNDKIAVQQLTSLDVSPERQVELYIYHLYGDVDATPDIKDRELQPSENFRPSKNCPSLDWESKDITIDGQPLTKRELKIIDLVLEDVPDKAIAAEFGRGNSTIDFHKRNLYKKAGVSSKTGLIIKALNQHV